MSDPPLKFWKMVHAQAWLETKQWARDSGGPPMLSLVIAVVGIVFLLLLGRNDGSLDEIILKIAGCVAIVCGAFWFYWQKVAEIPVRWHNEKVQIIEGLRAAQDAPPMPLRELALHLHGRVKRFSTIQDLDVRFDAVRLAVVDALGSSTALFAMGRR